MALLATLVAINRINFLVPYISAAIWVSVVFSDLPNIVAGTLLEERVSEYQYHEGLLGVGRPSP